MLYSTQTDITAKKFGIIEAVKMIADAGFPAMDLTLHNSMKDISFILGDDYKSVASDVLLAAKSRGAVFNQAHAPFFGNSDGTYPDMIQKLMPRCMEFCAELSIPHIVVHPYHPHYQGHEREIFDENIKLYRSLAPYSREYGVKIALENMWRRNRVSGNVIDSLYSSPIELCEAYDTLDNPDVFTVCLDIGHVALTGREPEDAIRYIGADRLGALHVHDVDYERDLHTLPGVVNKIRWNEVLSALGEINYRGAFTLEADYFLLGFEDELFPDALRFMNKVAKSFSDKVDTYRPKN